MEIPKIVVTRLGHVPTEQYGQAHIQWLAGKAASGAHELMFGLTRIDVGTDALRVAGLASADLDGDGVVDLVVDTGSAPLRLQGDPAGLRPFTAR